jgi:hypothetical protein
VSYSYIHRRKESLEQPSETFHTRHLSYPVLVTVYQMLECYGLDILPWSGQDGNSADSDDESTSSEQMLLADAKGDDGWFIFSIDVRNTYGQPFEVSFSREQPGNLVINLPLRAYSTTCLQIYYLWRRPGLSPQVLQLGEHKTRRLKSNSSLYVCLASLFLFVNFSCLKSTPLDPSRLCRIGNSS